MTTSSARPEALRHYRDTVGRAVADAGDAVPVAEMKAASFQASCPDGGPVETSMTATRSVLDHLARLAARTGDVADAFDAADRGRSGGLARTTDHHLAHVVLVHFPTLSNPMILGPVEAELARKVADELLEAARVQPDISTARALVPTALLGDPHFAKLVMDALGPHALASLTGLLAQGGLPRAWGGGRISPDLRWLADLFSRSIAVSKHSKRMEQMYDDPAMRNAIRVLRSSSTTKLDPESAQLLAERISLRHSAAEDSSNVAPFGFGDPADGDIRDDRILVDAAEVPGFALEWFTRGGDPNQIETRAARFIRRLGGGSGVGAAAFLAAAVKQQDAARKGDDDTEVDEALAAGVVRGVADLQPRHEDQHHLGKELATVVGRITTQNKTSLIAATSRPNRAERARATEDLITTLRYVVEWSGPLAETAAGVVADRRRATITLAGSGNDVPLATAATFEGLLYAAAARADAPLRRWDGVVDLAAAGLKVGLKQFGPVGSVAATVAVDPATDLLEDYLRSPEGTATDLIDRLTRTDRDLVVDMVDQLPPGTTLRWSDEIAGRYDIAQLGYDPASQRRLERWVRAQSPEVQEMFASTREEYATTVDEIIDKHVPTEPSAGQ